MGKFRGFWWGNSGEIAVSSNKFTIFCKILLDSGRLFQLETCQGNNYTKILKIIIDRRPFLLQVPCVARQSSRPTPTTRTTPIQAVGSLSDILNPHHRKNEPGAVEVVSPRPHPGKNWGRAGHAINRNRQNEGRGKSPAQLCTGPANPNPNPANPNPANPANP